MYDKKLSIIIPTKNRQVYALKCVKTLLSFPSNDFEIVIQDNSDDDSLKHSLGDLIDGVKLKYSYVPGCLSFCANFEKGVENSSGDYLITIGDDDCVFPDIVDLTNVIREKNICAAVFDTHTTYIWPNAVSKKGGRLVVRNQRNVVKKISTAPALTDMMRAGNYDYQQYSFPKIYHGIIKRESFDKVKAATGHYFGGLTPDIYSAVALSFYIDEILYVSTPFTLPGTCAKSGSADSLTGRHTGELKDAPHFRGHDNYEWNSDIPYVYSVDTIWAETAFKAATENGKNVALTSSEYFAFLTHIIKRSPLFKERMVDFYCTKSGCDATKAEELFDKAVARFSRRVKRRRWISAGMQVLKGRYVYNDVEDIDQALRFRVPKLKNTKKPLKW